MSRDMKPQKGSIMTIALGGIAMTAVLGIATFSLMSGPLNTMTSVNKKLIAQSQVEAIARIALMDAQTRSDSGDSDGDGIVELREGREGGAGIDPREYVPYALGAPTVDPWGSEYFYCVWDMGAESPSPASTLSLDGADDPFRASDDANAATKSAASQTLIAVFSAGADATANSTCADWTSDTAAVFTCAGDDICKKYTYSEAAKQVGGIWEIKEDEPTTITTTKNLEIGADISINAASGNAAFSTVETTGKIIATGGLQLPLETDGTVDALCGVSYEGLLRFNDATDLLQVCDGTAWVDIEAPAGSTSTQAQSEWTETSSGFGDIYYNDGGVMIGTTTIGASESLRMQSTDGPGAIFTGSSTELQTWDSTSDAPLVFTTPPAAGSTVVVFISAASSSGTSATITLPLTVTDNRGNTYTLAAQTSDMWPGGNYDGRSFIFVAPNVTTGATFTIDLSFNCSGAGCDRTARWGALEIVGLATSGVVDVTASANSSNASTQTITTASTTQSNTFAVAMHSAHSWGSPGPYGYGISSGWEQVFLYEDYPAGKPVSVVASPLNQIQAVSHTWTFSNADTSSNNFAGLVVALKGASTSVSTATARNIELAAHSDTLTDDANLDLYHAEGTVSSPQNIEVGDNSGYISHYGYNGGWKKGFQLTQEVNNATGASDYKLALGSSDDTLNTAMWLSDLPGLTVGPTRGSGGVNVSGTDPDILLDTYSTTAGNGSFVLLRKSRGSMPTTYSALQNGNMIGAITWQGQDSNSMSSAAAMNLLVNGSISTTTIGTDMVFQVSPAGNALATAINGEALRLRSGGDIAVNSTNQDDEMAVGGIMRITDTRHDDTLDTNMTQSTFLYIPSTSTWRMGYSDQSLGMVTTPTYNALTTGYDGENRANDSWHHGGSGEIGAGADHSIVFAGDTSAYGIGSYSIGSWASASPAGWTVDDATNSAAYSFVMSENEFTLGASASHSAVIASPNAVINGSHSYGFGSSFTIDNANATGGDYIFAVNLADVATTYTQARTFSVMHGNVGVGNDTPGTYRLLVTGGANKTAGGTTWDIASDARLKDVHGPYTKGLSHIRLLNPVRFRYKEGNPLGHDPTVEIPGFVAQAVQPVFPEAVRMREDGYLDFDMHSINVAKVNAVKELHAEQQALLEEQAALLEEQKKIREEYAALRHQADAMMNVAGIPSLRGFWTAAALPLLAFLALGLAATRRRV